MRQTLHIFRKDVRYLRHEIALVVLIALVFAALHARASNSDDLWWAELALVVAAAFLIGRLILAETIPGDRQFWITRPYRWRSLLGAKLLFIVVFVNLPVLLAHVFILIVDRFPIVSNLPGLLWSQWMLFAFVALPFAALATLSSSMAAFIFAQLIVLAIGFGVWEIFVPNATAQLGSVVWVRYSAALLVLAAAVISVIVIQYKSRRTFFSRACAMGGLLIAALAFLAMPWPLALAVQSRLSRQLPLGTSLQITLGHQSGERSWLAQMKPKVALHLPILVQGIPDGTEIEPDAIRISLQSDNGRSTATTLSDCADLKRESISAKSAAIMTKCLVDPAFFEQEHQRPVTLRVSLYLTLFGNARSQTIPLTDEPSNAPDGLQCYTDSVRAEWDVYCRSAFRWPSRLVYAKLGHTNANSFTQSVSYSPFPANLVIDPVETRWASAYAAGPTPVVHDVTIIVEEPLAHVQRDFEMHGVHLDELAYPTVRYLSGPPIASSADILR
ncbi:MAG TPA: hypothetical protein VME17_03745 [Bryobacteraceae bacterium]|nr:hypothetical protein [Bryobacteraceae bacterium]